MKKCNMIKKKITCDFLRDCESITPRSSYFLSFYFLVFFVFVWGRGGRVVPLYVTNGQGGL